MSALPTTSAELFERAAQTIPGGVNSPVRAFKSVGGTPPFIVRGQGPYLWDTEGKRYIDYVLSWGPMILGHAAEAPTQAVKSAAERGSSFGAPTPDEILLAEELRKLVPSMEMLRFVNSGTEATMSALRAARGFTSRSKFIKFSGCYHGHADAFLAEAGSGVATLGIPGSLGVPEGAVSDTLTAAFNDLEAVDRLFAANGGEIAAIIVEPVAGNMGLILPEDGFLEGLRERCTREGALLIFDEVMTGFRVAKGGAQARYGVKPDLSTFGKVVGGGLPVGAYGGRADVMGKVAPLGGVYQAGTLSGNPLAMAAGLATLRAVQDDGFYEGLDDIGEILCQGLAELLRKHDVPGQVSRCGTMFHLWFGQGDAPRNYEEVKAGDTALFGRFFHECLQRGLAWAPSAFEVGFLSNTHTIDVVTETIAISDAALAAARQS